LKKRNEFYNLPDPRENPIRHEIFWISRSTKKKYLDDLVVGVTSSYIMNYYLSKTRHELLKKTCLFLNKWSVEIGKKFYHPETFFSTQGIFLVL